MNSKTEKQNSNVILLGDQEKQLIYSLIFMVCQHKKKTIEVIPPDGFFGHSTIIIKKKQMKKEKQRSINLTFLTRKTYNLSMNQGFPSLVRRLVKISQPVSVTNRVCSNWAENKPSAVTAVQLSGHCLSRHVPSDIIGSMVNTLPAFITPTALFSKKKTKIRENSKE